MYRAEVRIELKPGVADPEGANTKKALELLGFRGVSAVKSVHAFSVDLDAKSESDAKATVDEMCKRLLVNPVIHAPQVTIRSVTAKTVTKAPAAAPAPKKAKPAPKAAKKPAAKPAKKPAKGKGRK